MGRTDISFLRIPSIQGGIQNFPFLRNNLEVNELLVRVLVRNNTSHLTLSYAKDM